MFAGSLHSRSGSHRFCWILGLVLAIVGGLAQGTRTRTKKPTLSTISMPTLREIIDRASKVVSRRINALEPEIYNSGTVLAPNSPAWFVAASAKTKIAAKNVSRLALLVEETTKMLKQRFFLSKDQIGKELLTVDVRGTALERHCPSSVDFPCQPRKYRAYSGYCNNVQHPNWGNANTPYVRYLSPDYVDGVNIPRQSAAGGVLPDSRLVSRTVHSRPERTHHPYLTVLMAVFADFVLHDIYHISQTAGYRGHRIRCCGVPSHLLHPECYVIKNSSSSNSDCMEYVRSSNAPRAGCTLGPREQINQATSFLDGSTIYGSSSEENRNLRAFKGGQMKMQNLSHSLHLLPPDVANMYDCKVSPITNHHCFLAGDVRVNENAGLMAMHTIWVREHNRIAQKLASSNPHWNDEQVFEETRRIVVAQLQHITYSELLPALLGVQVTRQFDLEPLSADEGFYAEYYIDVNPGTSNAVATAVAASFYSMLPSRFHLYAQELKKDGVAKPSAEAPKLKRVGSALASDTFFAPGPFYKGETLDKLIIGMANQRADAMDPFLASNTVSDHLKQPDLDSHAFNMSIDKVALIIQQGRDHGLPGYIAWRRICRLQPNISNFTDLSKVMPREAARRISTVYKDLRDVDLFTGGVSENPLVGGVVGPTFACLLSRQFQHLRRGDRHWYENDLPPATFTQDQLREIKKVSFARIICDNADIMTFIQPSVMLMPDSYLNALQTCESASPVIDLTKWKTNSPATDLPSSAILNSLKMAQKEIEARMAAEREIFNKNVGVAESRSPQAMHHVFLRPKRQSNVISNLSLILEMASLDYMHHVQLRDAERKLSDDEIASTMRALSSQNVIEYLEEAMSVPQDVFNPRESVRLCHEENSYPCDHTSPFRTISGWCNNLENPGWGKSFITVRRLMPPYYEDGISSPRSYGKSGDPLPSPRLVSTSVHYDTQAPHARYSLALMQWGQFLDHDLTLTPMYDAPGGRPLDCKSCDSTSTIHPECWPIVIPEKDPFFPSATRQNDSRCISFARSLAGQLTLGQREQLDQVTSFLDASNIYGSDPCESRMLRISHDGRLNMTRHPSGRGKDLLPQDISNVECRAPSGICFESGDIRASEQPGLTSMHTIWMREHNSIADQLSSINAHWDDELLYQHSRRIISAMMQSITYTEFLPRVLGESLWKQWNLAPSSDEDKIYDSRCDPTILNEFATAAYRFGHTLLKPALPRMKDTADSKIGKQKSIRLRHAFFNPDVLYEQGAIDEVLRGLLSTSVEVFDHSITSEVTNHLFEDSKKPFSGMDLVSLNLQRGRDHGIPPYNEYRTLCNRSRAEKFEDLAEDMPDHIIRRLLKVYKYVDDIDLFTGGISEKSMYGALVGPTFGCIIATQFQLLKKCDRFWYESKDPYIRFTKNQISEIRQRRLSKVICDNADSINMVQMSAMDLPDDFRNPRMPCSSLTPLDLSYWKENPNCHMPISDQSPKDKSDGFTVPLGQSAPMSPCVSCACTKEGLICQSIKVTNCYKLASEFSPKLVLADDVCKVQCAFAFRAYPKFENPILLSNQLGFSAS